MVEVTAVEVERRDAPAPFLEPVAVDPLGFLAGRRFTCYCGRSLVGAILCDDCAQEMARFFAAASRRRLGGAPPWWQGDGRPTP